MTARGAGLDDITSRDNRALAVEEQSAHDFGFPLLSRTVLVQVQADPAGLPQDVVQRSLERAADVAQGAASPVGAAFPVPGDARVPGCGVRGRR